jgi:hypothetical protein
MTKSQASQKVVDLRKSPETKALESLHKLRAIGSLQVVLDSMNSELSINATAVSTPIGKFDVLNKGRT